MKRLLARLPVAFQAMRQLGPARSFWYAVYQAGLRSGAYRQSSREGGRYPIGRLRSPYPLPDAETLRAVTGDRLPELIAEANEITAGRVRLFGGPPAALNLIPPHASHHWTHYEGKPQTWGAQDLKLIWEPARFGWVYPLGRAYLLTGEEAYPNAFWEYLETFLSANLPNQGPNWASAQEVGLRMLALLFAARVFEQAASSTLARMDRLARAIANHAERIPPTLSYARAQNNNHRITEALAMCAAGWSLTDHPNAKRWYEAGWRELNEALHSQIEPDGTYTQQSMNYHRLMLHAALQGGLLGRGYPEAVQQRLAAATRWLLVQIDRESGRAPNLGSNDGALILPLASRGFEDYRATAQAAARAFLNMNAFPPGPWDEVSLWLGLWPVPRADQPSEPDAQPSPTSTSLAVHRLGNDETWATLRAAQFRARPSHADQLHVDLWWRGENIAMDAGTYRYTAPPPWDNALAETRAHNTIEVNHQSQMRRAGRFLWLDWAQAELMPAPHTGHPALAAQHNGYRKIGALHHRTVELFEPQPPLRWLITDRVMPSREMPDNPQFELRLHWLLPDWPWQMDSSILKVQHPAGGFFTVTITVETGGESAGGGTTSTALSLVRAGESMAGVDVAEPILGWFSPTYNQKVPALSLIAAIRAPLPCTIISEWLLEARDRTG